MSILDILNQVAATSSRLEKEAILRENADNPVLKRVFKLAYDKQVLFFLSEAPSDDELLLLGWDQDLTHALDQFENWICQRKVTGHAALALIKATLANLSPDDREVARRVLEKDLKVGATSSTANKIWPDLIPKPAFMLAETDPKNIKYPAISDLKEDGTRGKFVFDGYGVDIITRNGNSVETLKRFDAWAQARLEKNTVIDGELVAFESTASDAKRLPRKVSNGIINKAVKGTITKEEAQLIRFVAWDLESHPGTTGQRRAALQDLLRAGDPVLVIEFKLVGSYLEAVQHFKEARLRGLEGTIVKNIDAQWQPKRSFDYVKFKAEIEAEFKVIKVEKGTGKNKDRVGNLIVASQDDKIVTGVGIFKDFPETVRDEWLTNPPKIVTVLYNERIKSKDPKATTESLFLPRVTAARYDKDVANTYEEILEIERNVLA